MSQFPFAVTVSPSQKNSSIHYTKHFSDEYAEQLSALIDDENQRKQRVHQGYSSMISKTPQEIQSQAEQYGGLLCFDDTKHLLVSALLLSHLGNYRNHDIFELGSVITHQNFRKQGYATHLMHQALNNFVDQCIVIVGTSDAINTMYTNNFADTLTAVDLDPKSDLYHLINTPPLGSDDVIYMTPQTAKKLLG